ncbi:MFS multidrug transporter [Aspergillus steynii IBT 23096]|uniref:MFS multidrug transporter n=1 Tax=Aspergillus steynii IBT 23096 TaxID=1392250 RepID=A0A2I2GHJ6_9EURO|nr:MFS multidrug transporter [Aspergillus steynii IBT 23096]PLB52350.1 MFS multidrug transporter [Aspergillus steynii IBT 23096]
MARESKELVPLEAGIPPEYSSSEEITWQPVHPHGWRLIITILGMFISLYLVNLEVTIVSTSLVTITDDLGGFDKTSWIVTAYLTTFTGFIPFWTRISDLIGRKRTINAALFMFLVFSMACALADNINQLIIFRALQGVGGAGVYPLSILCTYEVGPKEKIPIYGGLMSFAVALASLTGPIIGGVLADRALWRWVFYINLPPAALTILMIAIAMPTNFGTTPPGSLRLLKPNMTLFRRIDAFGVFLLLAASLLLITILNETFIEFAWNSTTAIVLLSVSGALWVAFFIWEWFIIARWQGYHPIFPKRFLSNRAWIGITTFVSACPWNVVIVYLSQRFIVLSQLSPLQAGIHLIPYSAVSTVATAIANLACLKGRIPFVYIVLFGSILHTVGMALLSTISPQGVFPAAGYGYEAVAGAGVGITIGNLLLAVPYVVNANDLSTATGALNQCRFLGGAVGLSIASNILNGRLKNLLSDVLPSDQLAMLLRSASSIAHLPEGIRAFTRDVFAGSYTLQMQVMIGFAAVQVLATLLMIRRGRQFVASAEGR